METIGYTPDSSALKEKVARIQGKFFFLYTRPAEVSADWNGLEKRMEQTAEIFNSAIVYSDYDKIDGNGNVTRHPLIDYQTGSIRDDFDFGPLILCRKDMALECTGAMEEGLRYASIYDLRLRISAYGQITHIPESLYQEKETDYRKSGEKQFDYVNPRNREVQIEMEKVCTGFLKRAGAYIPSANREISLGQEENLEASVIIPVFNRERTVADAIHSALEQECSFNFNVIVVDNHSTDRTSEIISRIAAGNKRLVHMVPERLDLGIGGCWNHAVNSRECGRFAIQLDSDDLYTDSGVIERIVKKFRKEKCGMVIGSYRMVDFNLEELPPGIIDHREWSDANGRNNALRINGLGAPRAFYRELARKIGFHNVSYGEDYAIALEICREYRIGRIYDPIYLCRRWEGNSDNNLPVVKLNAYNRYKDWIRTSELLARIRMNSNK